VLARGAGYVAYYTVRDSGSRQQCISRAVSATPAGPFVDDSDGPLVCQIADGGSIDPSPFVDADGRAFLLWKSEGRGGAPPTIWSRELSADGLALTGTARALLVADRAFERGVIEAPSLVHEAGGYYLLYAAADWNSRSYAVAYAGCAGPAGPCIKPGDAQVLLSGSRLAGPGGAEVFRDAAGSVWVAFHAFSEPDVGYPSSRYLHVARVRVVDGRIVLDATT
jgi:beta-xylosidase